MRIEINIEKKYFLALFTLMILLIGVVGAVAYTTGFPLTKKNVQQAQNFGHSADEIVIAGIDTDADGQNDGLITLQDWVDSNRLPSLNCADVTIAKNPSADQPLSGIYEIAESQAKDMSGQAICAAEFAGSTCVATVDPSGSGNAVGKCRTAGDFRNTDVVYCCALK